MAAPKSPLGAYLHSPVAQPDDSPAIADLRKRIHDAVLAALVEGEDYAAIHSVIGETFELLPGIEDVQQYDTGALASLRRALRAAPETDEPTPPAMEGAAA